MLRWYGHTEKMEEDQFVKRIIGSDVRGVLLRVNLQKRWMDCLKRALNERGMCLELEKMICE